METVQVELAAELISLARMEDEKPSRSAAKLIALELYREGRVSLGRASQLAGISLEDFMSFSASRDVPLHYTMEDWQQDQTTVRAGAAALPA